MIGWPVNYWPNYWPEAGEVLVAVARYIPIPRSMPRYRIIDPTHGPMVGGILRTGRGRK